MIWDHLYGYVMFMLMVLPFFAIGYVAGMLHMRANYFDLLNQARADAENQRKLGFAVGYKVGRGE